VASGQERILRRRIRSINSTKKITRAMELIAASRIVRAQARVHAAAPYADQITQVVQDLASAGGSSDSPLLVPRPEIRKVAHVVVAADRGLCGAYNSSIFRAAEGSIREHREAGRDYELVVVGRKTESYFRYRNYRVMAALAGDVDMVQLVYTRFASAGFQEVVIRPLMPLDRETFQAHEREGPAPDYEFEPGASEILERLLPRYAEARVYAALLNAAASEHAARQRAMKSATDNAEDLITSLTRTMNRARQDAITTEIMEVVGGAEALGNRRVKK
jgi:F-type H+-transporting ATPase subunit gamma